ncbi:MAG: hypothetical protein WCD49_02630 [Candidatus Acidiferrales bacterium]
MAAVACLAVVALSFSAAPAKVHLSMKFTPGEVLRYQIETSTTANNKMETPIDNPEAASKSTQSVSLILRLDVLNSAPANGEAPGSVRVRTTFEKSDAAFKSDAFDLAGANVQDQYKHLEGRSLEYTISPDGQVSHITGIDDLLANPVVAENVHAWMNGLSFGARLPKGGIEIGQKWNTDQPMEDTPLGGLVWKNRSTYLHDELCYSTDASQKPTTGAQPAASANLSCAVIVTEFKIIRNGDATPDDYARKGLDTSGTWTGTGGSLEYISLTDGTLIRSTQNSTQNMDVTILSIKTGSKIHYVSRLDSKSEISLLPAEASSTAQQP